MSGVKSRLNAQYFSWYFFFFYFPFFSSILYGGTPLFLAAPEFIILTSKIHALPRQQKLCTPFSPQSSFSVSTRFLLTPYVSSS